MTTFSEKLSGLPATVALAAGADHSDLAAAFRDSAGRPVLAVGSGGSAIVAEYLARCRETLRSGSTRTVTPMELVLGTEDLTGADVWLFSAGAENPDLRAAVHAAQARRARRIRLVTRRVDAAEALGLARRPHASVHVVPVAVQKDGFLATHSLVGSVAALLLASDVVSDDPIGGVAAAFAAAVDASVAERRRLELHETFSSLDRNDTLLVLFDPQLSCVATLIETSAWEAAICSVQRVDFRNFAHGRHTWIHHRSDRTMVLALTGHETRDTWRSIDDLLPAGVRRTSMDLGGGGRLDNAKAIVEGLAVVEALGLAARIDPGRPGIGEFGRSIYEDDALLGLSRRLDGATRQKRTASLARDEPATDQTGIHDAGAARLERLAEAAVGGVVFDYDGTLVSTPDRFDPPRAALVAELVRLHGLGVRLAVATGRGGSAGEALREVLPTEAHPDVLIGYYNGAYLRPLAVDIRSAPAPADPAIAETAGWLAARPDLFRRAFEPARHRMQITIEREDLADWESFGREIDACGSVRSGSVRVTRSGHSVDIVLAAASKLAVVEAIAAQLPAGSTVLRIGDSGSRQGNDNELLSHAYGISVGEVCGRRDGCWSLFGEELTGPEAVLRLLKALRPDAAGVVRVDIVSLGIDRTHESGTNGEHGT